MSNIFKNRAIYKLRRTNVKPLLTEENMARRLEWCTARKRRQWSGNKSIVYCDLDEAYFHCVTGKMMHVHVDDATPVRHVRNHLYPAKVMVVVLASAATKVGMWRVAEDTLSKRSSTTRAKNVLYQKDITMDNNVYFDLWTRADGIASVIRDSFPDVDKVVVQHDNAPAHVGQDVVNRIHAEINQADQVPEIEIESQPANSPDTNVCDLGLFSSLKTKVRKLRSIEKHRNYQAKALAPSDDDDDGDDDDEQSSSSSSSALPELTCGIKRLVKGKNERGSLCVECEETVEDGRNAIKCGVRGGWWHIDCLDDKPSEKALNVDDAWWACPQCMVHGCATVGRGRARAACIVCNTRNACQDCIENDNECEHWLQCTARRGFYHQGCAGVNDDDLDDDWVCRLCREMPGPLPVQAVVMPTKWPPDDTPMYKCVDIWHDSADAMFGAIELAWEQLNPDVLARLYETKPHVLMAIVGDRGGNRYKLPHWRAKK